MTDARPFDSTPFDTRVLLTEIHAEVERRRASGELPRELERELDRTFAEFAPVDAVDADFDTIVSKIERAAIIDLRPSMTSAYPGAAQMKQVVAKATAFYVRHVATQASGLFQGVARALRLLGKRLDELEGERGKKDLAPWQELEAGADAGGQSGASVREGWDAFVMAQLTGATTASPKGRVLHAHAGDGRLVRRLVDAGYDAYGVEPSPEAALAASDQVVDIRAGAAVDHLCTLPEGTLDGLVLSGLVERLDPTGLMQLVALAASRLRPGAALVVLSLHPDAWARTGPPLVVDLVPGRPIHPETWHALLARAGFVDGVTELGARPQLAAVASEGSSQWAAVNENFARLAEAAFGPADFAVSARRPR